MTIKYKTEDHADIDVFMFYVHNFGTLDLADRVEIKQAIIGYFHKDTPEHIKQELLDRVVQIFNTK